MQTNKQKKIFQEDTDLFNIYLYKNVQSYSKQQHIWFHLTAMQETKFIVSLALTVIQI